MRDASLEDRLVSEPAWREDLGLWLYGNARLLSGRLACAPSALGASVFDRNLLQRVEREAENAVFQHAVLVCACHNDAHRRAAVVPLRWGTPRVLVLSGGFRHHLGPNLNREPFAIAALWRYEWDPRADLAVSRRAPDKLPTYSTRNQTVDRLIRRLVEQGA